MYYSSYLIFYVSQKPASAKLYYLCYLSSGKSIHLKEVVIQIIRWRLITIVLPINIDIINFVGNKIDLFKLYFVIPNRSERIKIKFLFLIDIN